MNSHPDPVVMLQPGQPLRLPTVGSRRLTVRRGRLWLTQSGSPADHFLSAGQTFVLDAGRKAVVESDTVEPASLTLQPIGAAASFAAWLAAVRERLMRWLAQAQATRRQRCRAALDRRLLLDLDEHQLRDIGAPPAVLLAARALAGSRQRWAGQELPVPPGESPWR